MLTIKFIWFTKEFFAAFYVNIRPKMIFRSLSSFFISDHSLSLENFHFDAMKFAVVCSDLDSEGKRFDYFLYNNEK